MDNDLDTLRPEVKDPNLPATSPTKWRAEHCVTHHHACDCREWEHATRVAELEDRAERAEAELAALKARIAASMRAYHSSFEFTLDASTLYARATGIPGEETYALVKVED